MKLYRVENLIHNNGLWYNVSDGTDSGIVHDLNLSSHTLPMDYDETVALDKWRSAAEDLDQLKYWFTHKDLQKLIPLGFNLYEIDADIFKLHTTEWYSHPLFQEIGVKGRKLLDISVLLN